MCDSVAQCVSHHVHKANISASKATNFTKQGSGHIAHACADIDTLPLLAWHEDMLATLSPQLRPLLRHQHWFMVPIMCLARFSWAQQSLLHARVLSTVASRGVLELLLLMAHYGVFAGLPLLALSPLKALAFFALAEVRLFCCLSVFVRCSVFWTVLLP